MAFLRAKNELVGWDRVGGFLANWFLLLLAPLWTPFAFWWYCVTGKNFLRNLFTGKNLISE